MGTAYLSLQQFTTVNEAAELLGVNRATVYRWVRSGELHAAMIGHTLLLSRGAVETLAQRRHSGDAGRALLSSVVATPAIAGDVSASFDPTDDERRFKVTIRAEGETLCADVSFDQVPAQWVERVTELRRARRGDERPLLPSGEEPDGGKSRSIQT